MDSNVLNAVLMCILLFAFFAVAASLVYLVARVMFYGSDIVATRLRENVPRRRGFEPVMRRAETLEDVPGVYRVVGVARSDLSDVVLNLPSASAANAVKKAELQGIEVTKVERVEGA